MWGCDPWLEQIQTCLLFKMSLIWALSLLISLKAQTRELPSCVSDSSHTGGVTSSAPNSWLPTLTTGSVMHLLCHFNYRSLSGEARCKLCAFSPLFGLPPALHTAPLHLHPPPSLLCSFSSLVLYIYSLIHSSTNKVICWKQHHSEETVSRGTRRPVFNIPHKVL